MPCLGVAIVFYSLGLVSFVVLWAWLDEREDGFCNVVIPERTTTSIDWHLHTIAQDAKCIVDIPTRRPGGHLGHFDHKARLRYARWMEDYHAVQTYPK